MRYFKVLPGSLQYHGHDALVYAYESNLPTGAVVVVPLQSKNVLGIVTAKTQKPNLKTKPIIRLISTKPLPSATIELLEWMRIYYPASLGSSISQFLPSSLITRPSKENISVATAQNRYNKTMPQLTDEQLLVIQSIQKSSTKSSSWLLHGQTGSGKTRVYTELAQKSLNEDRSVLILTPEIGLIPQLANRFLESLKTDVVVLHSNLSPAKRRNSWLKILEASRPLVVIGPRSALFSPLDNIGLVVIDEAHEPAYKQEQSPYYYAPRVAAKLAQIHKATLIYGSATPSVSDYYLYQHKRGSILRMHKLAIGKSLQQPTTKVINIRDRQNFNHHLFLSDALLKGLQNALKADEQSLIFLNRRGSARLVLCQNCGWQARCPVCDLALTYHQDIHALRCHTCGYKQAAPLACPQCRDTNIIFKSAGTKAIVDALKSYFPKAKILRFDTDNTAAEKLERHYEAIVRGKVDILVGTQMVGKGLDLPRLSFVGVVSADTSLHFPDFASEERTFQLLYQILGRVGRGHRKGSAVIQTFQPKSPAILAALNKDWPLFYKAQVKERQKFGFPPFYHLLRLSIGKKNQKTSQSAADTLKKQLEQTSLKVKIIGPSPAFYEKQGGKYYWQLVVKAKNRPELIKIVKTLPPNWSYDIDPINLI